MSILIACSPSTGSSLLRRILNRHSQIFCGPETSLFAKKQLYNNWQLFRNQLLNGPIRKIENVGWHAIRGINLLDENDFKSTDIEKMASESEFYLDFINSYFERLMSDSGKTLWAEKTPSNAFAIDDFRNLFPNSLLIHIVRNPFDTVASLINRGMSIYNALTVCLLNVGQCLEHQNKPYYYEIRYEDLVNRPIESINELCLFLNVEYQENMIYNAGNELGVDHMKGWNYKETAKIGNESIGRFEKLSNKNKKLIFNGMQNLHVKLDVENKNYSDVFGALNYEYLKGQKTKKVDFYFRKEMKLDKLKRSMRSTFFKAKNYPISWTA